MKASTITYAWPDDLWRCPSCRCSSYARMDERGADGHFAPGPGIRCVECKNTFFPPTPTPPDIAALAAQVAEKVLMDVCELPDRTSPADWPEAMLVTGEELDWIVKEHVATALQRLSDDLAREREDYAATLSIVRAEWAAQVENLRGEP